MVSYPTLSGYIAKSFFKQFITVSLVVICILFITNTFDTIQKFKSSTVESQDFWQLILLKIPYLLNEVSALISFIATFLFLRNIARHNELLVILSNGVSVWRIFIVPVIVTFVIGVIMLCVINPISTYAMQKYEQIAANIDGKQPNNFVVSQSGIFFREIFEQNNRIIQAKSINASEKILYDVTILLLDTNNALDQRIDAPSAYLDSGEFKLSSAIVTSSNSSEKQKELKLSTNLSIEKLMQRFVAPEMISFWNLKDSIEKFAYSGLVVTKYQLYYYKQLFRPLSMVAMSFIACWFLSLNMRDNSSFRTAVGGLVIGICAYFFLEIALHILVYSGLQPIFATLLPILCIIFISNFVILHFQES